jgi:SAM-dependent methyltransferase
MRRMDAHPPALLPPPPPALAVRLVLGLRRLLLRAADAVVPAQVALFDRAIGTGVTGLVGLAAHFRFADHLADGPMPVEELARRCGLLPEPTERVLRAMATCGLFTRTLDGRYGNNRLSRALQSDQLASMRSFCAYMASKSNLDAWSALRETVRTGRNGFEQVHGMSVWDWFDRHPDEREVFASAMVSLTEIDAPGIARAYPWKEVARVCDVGGGRGQLLAEILRVNGHLQGMLVDGAGVLASATAFLEAQGVASRVQRIPGSFFEHVPAGAELYLLKDILHDWDDARSLQILRLCRAALAPGGRVLICEQLVERETTHGFGPLVDVQMMVVCCEGRQRSQREHARLLDQAGFSLGRVLHTATPTSLVEGIAR